MYGHWCRTTRRRAAHPTSMTKPPTPFSDLVVVELGHSVSAPFAGQIFGDLGAEVIKIENTSRGSW